MLDKTDEPIQIRRICGVRIKYAKLEGNGDKDLRSARLEKNSPPSRQLEVLNEPLSAEQECCAPDKTIRKEGVNMTSDDWKAMGFVFEASPEKTLKIDMARYEDLFEEADLSDDEKQEVIIQLWRIIIPFVDLGFKVSPLELACGKLPENREETGNQDSAVLEYKAETLTEKFNHLAAE